MDITPSSRASISMPRRAGRLDRGGARPHAAVLHLERRVAQLGERARERVASDVGHVRRGLRAERAGHQALVEHRRERAEAHQRAGRAPVGGGRHQQRQAGVEPLQLARFEEDGDHALIVGTPPRTLDVRGLQCPLPLIRARRVLAGMDAGETLVVLATDPEAPIDLAALAADEGHAFAREQHGDEWAHHVDEGCGRAVVSRWRATRLDNRT